MISRYSGSEVPFDPAGPNDPCDLLAKVPFERWSPRQETETEAIIDHGETSREQVEPPPIDAGNELAFV
jgi:hypothetical protein